MINDSVPQLPPRPANAHKGSFGAILVVGGHATMVGAPCFVAMGALRVGCGLVRLAVPPQILTACLGVVPSVIGIPRDATHAQVMTAIDAQTIIAAGPGLGLGRDEEALIQRLMTADRPLVLDGDGLTHLAHLGTAVLPRQAPLILTPHLSEYGRLAAAWGLAALNNDSPADERRTAAMALARATKAVVVLKGHGTVVSDGADCWTCTAGNSALAIPGSGDVLTGVIAGLLGQGMRPFAAATLGAQLHGMAGDLWAECRPFGMLASELAALIPDAASALSLPQA